MRYVLFSIWMSVSVLVQAQNWTPLSREAIDSIMNPKLVEGIDRIVRFDSVVSHIGKMTEDHRPVKTTFHFQYLGKAPLVITRLRTDCGCTDAKVDKLQYSTGEKGMITVEYTPENHPGTIDVSTFVYSSISETHPIAKLTLLGEVLPNEDIWDRFRFRMGELRLKQRQITFEFNGERYLTERILCGNSGDKELKLSVSHLPDYIQFRTAPMIISPGEEADIVVKVDASRLDSDIELPLRLEGLNVSDGEIKLIIKLNKKDK